MGFTLFLSLCALAVAICALLRALCDHFLYKRKVEVLQRRVLEAQRNLRRVGDLANEVAHEIKNPITAIHCSAESLDLLIGEEIDQLHRKSLQYIKEYSDHILSLVSDFLDVSRAEAGRLQPHPEPLTLASSVETIVGLLEANAIRKKIEVKMFIVDESLQAFIDPRHFKQVLFNLIHNAIKFTPAGGEVHVVVKNEFPEPFIRVSVKDNGIGIAEEEIEHLFDPYATYSGPEAALDVGAGIGLSLCKSLIEMAGGEVTVKSTVGVGSSFELCLPRHEAAPPKEATQGDGNFQQESADKQPLAGQTFLIVDEHVGSRESVSRLIEAWGGMVDRVELAADAIRALESRNYDAVMIDDSLDGVYAMELSRMLKEELQLEDTTIIIASDEECSPGLLRKSGVDKWIEKPFKGEKLLSSLVKSGKYSITH